MNRKERREFYKEVYFFELERKDRMAASLQLPVTTTLLLVGAVVYFVKEWPSSAADGFSLFVVLLCFGLATLFLCMILLGAAWWPYRYKQIANLKSLKDYHAYLVNFYRGHYANPRPAASRQFESRLTERICDAATKNAAVNKLRGQLRQSGIAALFMTAVFFACAFPAHQASKSNTKKITSGESVPASMRIENRNG